MPGYDPVHELNVLKTENDQLKRALSNNEERFGQVLEGFSEAVWETNAQGVAVKDSVTWRDYTGQTIEEWLGHGWVHAVHLEDREFVELEWRKALLSGKSINIECRLRYASGAYHWARVRAVPVPDADGRIEKWFGMVYDIDKRKRTEESLRTSEEKYRTLFNSIDEGFFVIDVLFDEHDKPIDIYYVEANTAATRMLGNNYAGKRLRDISPDYEEYWYQIFGKVALTGQSVRLERYAAPDRKWYSFYVFRIGGPESRRIGNTFQDITERKKADEALIHQWRLMQRIMDELPVAVSIVQGNDLRIQYANPAFRIMAPDRELVGRTTTQAMSDGQPHIDNVLLEVLTTGETYTEIDQPYPVVRSPKSHRELAYFTSSVSRILMPDANWGLLITFVET
ncbi:MAG TPA: PAS domain-containing protein, partial [Syntrophorhabdaceae bacterium]|nr:PAS domain-containing protein [Syntrophorhabdaceae bacterium]